VIVTWDGTVDTSSLTSRGYRRLPYEEIPTVCAGMILCVVPRRHVGPKFYVRLEADAEPRDLARWVDWEEGIPMLRENYVTVAIDSNGRPHVVWASSQAWAAGAEILRTLRRLDSSHF
jgi:hypothetical protein